MSFQFRDRSQAGRFLAEKLEGQIEGSRATVLALLRGGVPVGIEVADRLGAPLDVFIVRKLGAPGQEELAIGAIASGGVQFLNQDIIHALHLSPAQIEKIIAREEVELRRREEAFRPESGGPAVRGRHAILVDDGLATGATMRAAVGAVHQLSPARITVAVPVAARETCEEFERIADDIVCVQTPPDFRGVGQWYEDFTQTSDDEVRALLAQASHRLHAVPAQAGSSYSDI